MKLFFFLIEIPCFKPANGETITIETPHGIPVDIEPALVQQLKGMLQNFDQPMNLLRIDQFFNRRDS